MSVVQTGISVSDHRWVSGWLKCIAPDLVYEIQHYDCPVNHGWETKIAVVYEEDEIIESLNIMTKLQTGKTVFELITYYVTNRITPEVAQCKY